MNGLSVAEARALRDVFTPAFEGSFRLECPQLESMKRSLKRLKASGSVGELVEKTWLSTYYKVLDIACPLVQLWSQVPPGDAANQYIESALRLWGCCLFVDHEESEEEYFEANCSGLHQSFDGSIAVFQS